MTKEIIDKLLSDQINETTLFKIWSLLFINNESKEWFISHINSLNIPKEQSLILTEKIVSYGSQYNIRKYLESKSLDINDYQNKIFNILEYFSFIEKDLLNFLYSYTWNTSPSIGNGEIFLTLFFKNFKRSPHNCSSDIIFYSDKEYKLEVKGNCGRLRGQIGFGDYNALRNHLFESFNSFLKSHNIDFEILKSDRFWNFTRNNWGIEQITKNIPNFKQYKTEICCFIGEAFKKMYIDANFFELVTFFYDNIDDNGLFRPDFIKNFAHYSFMYYAKIENFDYMSILDKKGNVLIFHKDDFLKQYELGNIKMIIPNYSKRAGIQGSVFAIQINKINV